jgi:hypothetical protein
MTATTVDTDVLRDALAAVDRNLAQVMHRDVLTGNEVTDMLLDLRLLLLAAAGSGDDLN